jgi:hypothetical protein
MEDSKVYRLNACVYCVTPFWLGNSGLDSLLMNRYRFLCRVFEEVQVLFVTQSRLICPLPGETLTVRGPLVARDVASVKLWCRRNKISVHYSFLDCLPGLIEHLDGQKLCEISDVWHLRSKAFAAFGYQHGSNEKAELSNMKLYDTVFLLNPSEASYLLQKGIAHARQLLPCASFNAVTASDAASAAGMIGAANHPNAHGVRQLDQFVARIESFVLAGDICGVADAKALPQQKVTYMGRVADPEHFYRRVTTVVSPIQFGAGLKMKVLEAISYGKPLLATAHSVEGYPDGIEEFVTTGDDPKDWSTADLERAQATTNIEHQREYIEQNFSDRALLACLTAVL